MWCAVFELAISLESRICANILFIKLYIHVICLHLMDILGNLIVYLYLLYNSNVKGSIGCHKKSKLRRMSTHILSSRLIDRLID